jgi:acetyl esterase
MRKFLLVAGGATVGAIIAIVLAFALTPYPAVLVIRHQFEAGAAARSAALARHVPAGVTSKIDVIYDARSRSGKLDLFYPSTATAADLTAVVWVHGGAWVSGTKSQIDAYAKILASRGFTVASVDYTIAPRAHYPVPVSQVNDALKYLSQHAPRYRIDAHRFVLAGDSGGAQIAAQVANLITSPYYARTLHIEPAIAARDLAGTLLFCGAYDITKVRLDGEFGGFLRTVLWAYSGTKAFQTDGYFATASVAAYVTAAFPPSFISVGNADPLAAQSYEFARALERRGVRTDTLFFPVAYEPPLGHEYQFDLDVPEGKLALDRSVAFLRRSGP